ncbi:threonine aldolase family protein [Bradyrhizobium prioriisuperbiae]|uniref:threonine aldolase family protein n=1 Tax=Bradyrhizobium prioriisuperbiae TaxID=2854389 RepID=UPI0028E8BCD9|nr:threonine aldolase family protein [Bradyrhizobium prioritasuperba]
MAYTPVPHDPSLPPIRINLLSDTQTRPTVAMRKAMSDAEVGDEQFGLDPTVNALCARVAALLGKEAAMFLPSGTMCNVVALLTHCRPGDEILAHETAHVLTSEGGTHAALGGFQIFPLQGPRGQFSGATLTAALRTPSRYAPRQVVVSAEQTANIGGGTIWPKTNLDEVARIAKASGLATHLDGARLMNACVATGIAAHDMAAGWDTVWLDFTKGLGAPLGAALAGSREFIGEAWRWKQRLGGSMRQAGLSAAGCLYALDHHIDRLKDDHDNARLLASGLAQIPGFQVQSPDTNLVFFDTKAASLPPQRLITTLRQHGILMSTLGGRIRACTHLDVTSAMIEETLGLIREVARAV